MTVKKLKNAIDALGVNHAQLAMLMGKHPNSINNYLRGKTKIAHTEELAIEALIHRKLDGTLWKDMAK